MEPPALTMQIRVLKTPSGSFCVLRIQKTRHQSFVFFFHRFGFCHVMGPCDFLSPRHYKEGLRGRAVWFQGWVQLCLERCGLHGPTQCWPVLQHQHDGPKEWRLLLGSSRVARWTNGSEAGGFIAWVDRELQSTIRRYASFQETPSLHAKGSLGYLNSMYFSILYKMHMGRKQILRGFSVFSRPIFLICVCVGNVKRFV